MSSVKHSKLYFETKGLSSRAEVLGTTEEILFNWALLTNIVCQKVGLTPTVLSAMMPGMVDTITRTAVRNAMEIDLSALRGTWREGQP